MPSSATTHYGIPCINTKKSLDSKHGCSPTSGRGENIARLPWAAASEWLCAWKSVVHYAGYVGVSGTGAPRSRNEAHGALRFRSRRDGIHCWHALPVLRVRVGALLHSACIDQGGQCRLYFCVSSGRRCACAVFYIHHQRPIQWQPTTRIAHKRNKNKENQINTLCAIAVNLHMWYSHS